MQLIAVMFFMHHCVASRMTKLKATACYRKLLVWSTFPFDFTGQILASKFLFSLITVERYLKIGETSLWECQWKCLSFI